MPSSFGRPSALFLPQYPGNGSGRPVKEKHHSSEGDGGNVVYKCLFSPLTLFIQAPQCVLHYFPLPLPRTLSSFESTNWPKLESLHFHSKVVEWTALTLLIGSSNNHFVRREGHARPSQTLKRGEVRNALIIQVWLTTWSYGDEYPIINVWRWRNLA